MVQKSEFQNSEFLLYIEFPAGEVFIKAVDGFEDKWGFPQCIGAIDGSHVPIAAPEFNHTDYYN